MIKIEHIDVWGWEHAIRGMRNPMNSWEKSDSEYKRMCSSLGPNEAPHWCNHCGYDACDPFLYEEQFMIGPNDLDLMRKLFAAGTEHRKFMRQIFVSLDVIAPLYWWKEADTYKVGTVANSCSTMHKIHAKEFVLDDFSHEHLLEDEAIEFMKHLVDGLNFYRKKFLETKDKVYWWQMIQLLPSSYNQRRTLTMNYEVAATIIWQREGHKLDEWNEFVKVLKGLPYMAEITGGETE